MKKILVVVLFALSFHLYADNALSVSAAWIPEAPPVAKVMAGYLEIKNNSDSKIILKSVSAKDFERVEMHETVTKDGVAKMVEKTAIEIPAQGSVSFKRGGLHLMLIGPKRSLKRGDTVDLTLTTDKASSKTSFSVKQATLDDHSTHQHHHHH